MRNIELAMILEEIADLLEIKGENPYKIRAYRRGAQSISLLGDDVGEVSGRQSLQKIDGIGPALAGKIDEWVQTGTIEYHERLCSEVPKGLIQVMEVPGIGAKLAWRMYQELGLRDVAELRQAVESGRLRDVRGLGPKAEENIRRALTQHDVGTSGRLPIGDAFPLGQNVLTWIRSIPEVVRADLAGSLRRGKESIGDLDIVVATEDPLAVMDRFVSEVGAQQVLSQGPAKSSVLLGGGVQVDLRAVKPEEFASALHHFTGSEAHHIQLRERASKQGLRISEYGVLDRESGAVFCPASEHELYERIGLAYIPPELREGRGEIEAALSGKLPRLVERSDLRGDLHMHTDWSDGAVGLREMAEAAKARGHEYIAVCDHSKSLHIANGLDEDRVRRQGDAIRDVQEKVPGIRILRGIEVDILGDGELDLEDEVLAELDVVVASVHSRMRQDRDQMTRRLIRAAANPNVDIIGHPTGRILGRREPYDVDFDALFAAAAEHGTALEINASPSRLDLRDELAAKAQAAGVVLSINSDAHSVDELDYLPYGLSVARRAWLAPENVLNTFRLAELLTWCAGERGA